MKKYIVILLLMAPLVLDAQSINVELKIYDRNIKWLDGHYLNFFDDNLDGKYDRLSKIFPDNSYEDYQMESNYLGALDKNYIPIILKGSFKDTNIIIQIDTEDRRKVVAILMWVDFKNKYLLALADKNVDPNSAFIQITPNPSKDFIEFSYAGTDSYNLKISDEQGKDVTNLASIVADFNDKMKLNITGLVQGVYFIKIGNKIGKFIKI